MNETAILQDIASRTQSELILFFVIMVVVLVVFLLPLYRMISKEKKEKLDHENTRQDKYIEREKQIIQVISENSQVIAELKTMLKENGAATNNSLVRIHERIDDQNKSINNLSKQITKIESILERPKIRKDDDNEQFEPS